MNRFLLLGIMYLMSIQINATKFNTIVNDTFWKTVDGDYIFSQGGGIFRFPDPETGEEHYYWYGVRYEEAVNYAANPTGGSNSNITRYQAVTCYRSDDLVNWSYVRDVMDTATFDDIGFPAWIGRLGVAYVPEAGVYALMVQTEYIDGAGEYLKRVGVFTCESPTGDFKVNQLIDMTGMTGLPNTGDQTVFTDTDGSSYLCYSYGKGRNKIYLSKIGVTDDGKIGLLDCNKIYSGSGREGDCMFKYKDKYYVCASDLYGWNASNVYYLEAEKIEGPYTPVNNMVKMPGASDDYGHVTQTGFFYTLRGTKEETVIYCGDRWAGFAGNGNGFNQWCPISFDDDKPYFNSLSQWDLNPETGEWKPGAENNYIKNFSFDADRKEIPSTNKPAQTYLKGWTFDIIKGNKVAQGAENSPVLNAKNSADDRKIVDGNFSLNVSDNIDFTRKIYQNIKSTARVPLPDGVYTMTCKVKCANKFNDLYIYALTNSGTHKCHITYADNEWHTVTIENIGIYGGLAEVGIYADGKAMDTARFDDITLVRTGELTAAENVGTDIDNNAGHTDYITLTGIKSDSPVNGINIVREIRNGKTFTKKVIINN